MSAGYQLGGLLGGALAPMIATALLQWKGGTSWPVATYRAILSLINLITVYLASDRYWVRIQSQDAVLRRTVSGGI